MGFDTRNPKRKNRLHPPQHPARPALRGTRKVARAAIAWIERQAVECGLVLNARRHVRVHGLPEALELPRRRRRGSQDVGRRRNGCVAGRPGPVHWTVQSPSGDSLNPEGPRTQPIACVAICLADCQRCGCGRTGTVRRAAHWQCCPACRRPRRRPGRAALWQLPRKLAGRRVALSPADSSANWEILRILWKFHFS